MRVAQEDVSGVWASSSHSILLELPTRPKSRVFEMRKPHDPGTRNASETRPMRPPGWTVRPWNERPVECPVDYCPECRGIWLDRGELDRILERATARDATRVLADPARGDACEQPHHSYQESKKRFSFLSDLLAGGGGED